MVATRGGPAPSRDCPPRNKRRTFRRVCPSRASDAAKPRAHSFQHTPMRLWSQLTNAAENQGLIERMQLIASHPAQFGERAELKIARFKRHAGRVT